MSSGTCPCPRCGIVRAARNAVALCRDCADTDPTWGRVDDDDDPYCSQGCRDNAAQAWDERVHAPRGWVA